MCRLEKFHLPLRPNLKDWNMMTLNKKWMRLMVLVGCAALTASCKQAPVAQMEAEYAVLKVSPSDKVLSTTYSATIRGRISSRQNFVYYLFGYDPWPPGY